ncbi:protein kinase [Streptomyces sp. SP17BM10]|uniref:serine/threonine-protein kinase n=1 Tax=Streptomyces sp. SP17BM10 TaxID=3002530 RepID=UPI002E78966F|nr:protein kinase [Streptomyces sp. SP17BM10]MEE1789033.1 protein kinase [Streptomyces sp. SP17BM10]
MQALGSDDPRQVGAYRLLRRLGAGGMGRVYLGRTAGGRTVAVKLVRGELADDAEFRARFRQEVAAARRVGGAWTAPVLDADTEGEQPWVATGYVAGPPLGTAVHDGGPLPEAAVRALGVGLAEALAHVHGLGLVHRDVKPSNVLLTLDGPRLIDFGIARALDAASGFTQSGYVVGSPGFMSPEQANGQAVGPAGDVFSLGAVLAFAATGVHPFGEGVSAAVLLYRVLHEQPDVPGLSGPLRSIVLDCLAKEPADRPTPQQLRARLDPEGEAALRLRQGGWLPPALAAGVGRSAIELLDLEGESESVSADVPPAARGPVSGSAAGAVAGPAGGTDSGPVSGAFPGAFPGVERTPTYVPPAAGAGARPRRTVPAAALAAALVVLVGGAYGTYRWLNPAAPVVTATGSGSPAAPSGSGSAAPEPAPASDGPTEAASTSGTPGTSGGPNAVPAAFLGTWTGDMVTDKGLPAGTTRLTVGPAAIGQENTTSQNGMSGIISISCEGVWKLREAGPKKLVFQSRLVRSSLPGACSGGAYTETLTLQDDGTVRFTSADPVAGNPAGTMHRTGAAPSDGSPR